jgi:hypothetical protein
MRRPMTLRPIELEAGRISDGACALTDPITTARQRS